MEKRILAVVIFIVVVTNLYSQDKSVVPPSPTAYEITKYGRIPIGMFTGSMNYSIPIFNIEERNMSLPISLAYSTNGVKVDQISSWVGMSWTLNAGGCITRIVRDKIDKNAPIPEDLESGGNYAISEYVNNEDYYDSEPDIYSYNFMGFTGKFTRYHPTQAVDKFIPIPYDKLKIEKKNGAFVITDAEGIKYYFGDIETSNPIMTGCAQFNHFSLTESAWYLSKIVHPTGEEINLKYKRKFFTYDSGITESYGIDNTYNCHTCPGNPASFTTCNVRIQTSTIYLDSICSENHIVVFKSTSDRLDLDGYKLDSLIIVDRNTSDAIKKFAFTYEFPKNINASGSSQNDYRMFLSYFEELNAINASRQGLYFFGYDSYNDLPSRLSMSQDHWGYFNGKINTKFCPITEEEKNYILYTGGSLKSVWDAFSELRTVNRDPDSLYTAKGTLKTIYFPTGARVNIDYEPNRTSNHPQAGGVRVKRIKRMQGFSQDLGVERYYYSNGQGMLSTPKYFSKKYGHTDTDAEPGCGECKIANCIYYVMSSNSNHNLFASGFNNVVYETVTKGYGENFENGGEKNEFLMMPFNYTGEVINIASRSDNALSESDVSQLAPYINYTDYSGKLLHKTILAPDRQTKLRIEDYTYNGEKVYYPSHVSDTDLRNGIDIPAYHINKCFTYNFITNQGSPGAGVYDTNPPPLYHHCTAEDVQNSSHPCYGNTAGSYVIVDGIDEYDVIRYNIVSRWVYLKKKTITQYDQSGNNPVITEQHFFYENEDHAQLTRDSSLNSNNESVENFYRYPSDINTGIYEEMADLNMLNYPIEQSTKVDENWTKSALTTFKTDAGNYVPDKRYVVETNSPLSSFTSYNGTEMDDAYGDDPELSYIKYNTSGRLIKAHNTSGIYTYYLWAYNDLYPVAKIESSNNVTISVSVNDTQFSNSDIYYSDASKGIEKDVAYLRGLLSTYVNNPDYMVSFYTYKPLVGMTSETDPAGRTTYYEYDDFGRLKYVRDQNGNIIKRHEYHYATQTTN
nr:RHS repeat domain-containing protein [uncultured Draconibacterium sp.]